MSLHKRSSWLLAPLALAFISVPASAISLQQLIDDRVNQRGTFGCLEIGDKKFCDFSVQSTDIVANEIDVVTDGGANGPWGVNFQGGFFANQANPIFDMKLRFTVETTSGLPLISAIQQAILVQGVLGTSGAVSLTEYATSGDYFGNAGAILQAVSTVSADNPGGPDLQDPFAELSQGDDLIIDPPLSKVFIRKDFGAIYNSGSGFFGASGIYQRFEQVPEPGFYGLLSLGMAGLWMAARRRNQTL
jgi:hypothetical protein